MENLGKSVLDDDSYVSDHLLVYNLKLLLFCYEMSKISPDVGVNCTKFGQI